jgi:RNA-dependent RNA polymerase
MRKYTSRNRSLDVLNWTKYRPCFLNRQIITLLSTLGVEGHHFQTLQKEAVELINQVLTSRDKALDVLQILYIGENHNVLIDMLSCGHCPRSEPYLSMMLQAFRAPKFMELRNKACIFVPKGRCLMGCLDETRTRNYGEVFIQIRDAPGNKQQCSAGHDLPCIMEGKVVVAKNPCLHPGDI